MPKKEKKNTKKKKVSRKAGQPTSFTEEKGDLICGLIAEGKSIRQIVALPDMPVMSTIMLWVLKGVKGEEPYVKFSEQYTHAVEMRTDYWAEEILDISDNDMDDAIFTDDGKRVQNTEFIQRSKLKIETRKWLMGKLKPKKYGDKATMDVNITKHEIAIDDLA